MTTAEDFFRNRLDDAPKVLRRVHAPPPKATLGGRRQRFALGAAVAATMGLTTVLGLPLQATGSATPRVVTLRPFSLRRRITRPRNVHREVVSHEIISLKPRQVLAFRKTIIGRKAAPVIYREDSDE